jgi:hypothetical protein
LANPAPKPAAAPTDCKYTGAAPRLIYQVDEKREKIAGTFSVKGADGKNYPLQFDDEINFGTGGKLPFGEEVSKFEPDIKKRILFQPATEADLRQKILVLPKTYGYSTQPMAANEFNAFLMKNSAVHIYTDPHLDQTVLSDDHFKAFSDFTLNAPGLGHYDPARPRLHQFLQIVGWNINYVTPQKLKDFSKKNPWGVLAFDEGSRQVPIPIMGTSGDFANGLKIMIDSVCHTLIFVKDYSYSSKSNKYDIELLFELYDGFGLNDANIHLAGYKAQTGNRFPENEGFTAWWQLQHQLAYAPLVTKVSVTRRFTDVPAI